MTSASLPKFLGTGKETSLRAMFGTEHIHGLPTKRAGGPVGGKAEHQGRLDRFQNSQSRSRYSRRSRAALRLARSEAGKNGSERD